MQQSKAKRAFHGMVGMPHEPNEPPVVSPPTPTISEDDARALFGVKEEEPKPNALVKCMRSTLMLEPEDLIALFDESPATVVASQEQLQQIDFLVTPEMLQRRIERLKKIIAASKAIVDGLSVHIMKLRRGKDGVLDKATREKFKRDENARISRSNVKLFQYRAALAGGLTQKVWRWRLKPVYFHDLVDDTMTFEEFGECNYARDKLKRPASGGEYWTMNLVREVVTRTLSVERYELMMGLDAYTLRLSGTTEEEQQRSWANVQRWENCVIKAAVFHGVLRPRADLLEFLSLTEYVQHLQGVDDNPTEADTTEDKLAIKSGGACYRGSIHSGGYRNGKRRALESFDKHAPLRTWEEGGGEYQDPSTPSIGDHSDDAESYDAR